MSELVAHHQPRRFSEADVPHSKSSPQEVQSSSILKASSVKLPVLVFSQDLDLVWSNEAAVELLNASHQDCIIDGSKIKLNASHVIASLEDQDRTMSDSLGGPEQDRDTFTTSIAFKRIKTKLMQLAFETSILDFGGTCTLGFYTLDDVGNAIRKVTSCDVHIAVSSEDNFVITILRRSQSPSAKVPQSSDNPIHDSGSSEGGASLLSHSSNSDTSHSHHTHITSTSSLNFVDQAKVAPVSRTTHHALEEKSVSTLEAEARKARSHFRAVLGGLDIGIISIDLEGRTTFYEGNDQSWHASGCHLQRPFISASYKHLYSDVRLAEAVEAILSQRETAICIILEREDLDRETNMAYCKFCLVPLRVQDERFGDSPPTPSAWSPSASAASTPSPPQGVIIVVTDVTKHVQTEEAFHKAELERVELRASSSAAEEENRLKTALLTTVSHELRTPLTSILCICELLLDDRTLSNNAQDLVKQAMQSGGHLLDLISQILDMRRIESKEMQLEEAPFRLADLFADTSITSICAKKKGVNYFEEIQPVYPDLVLGDRLRLRQILGNALSNAIKFSRPGGSVVLRIHQESVTSEKIELVAEVRDSGIGIDEAVLPTLFEPFRQADPSTARKFGGTGLGLAIIKNFVELLGGTVKLASKVEEGTSLMMRIPLKKATMLVTPKAREPIVAKKNEVRSTSKRDASTVKILLAEDNGVIREMISRILRKFKFQVATAEDGAQAVDAVHREHFDLILMDGQMPVKDGYQATSDIRRSSDPRVASVKIVALTASSIEGDKERCLNVGMDDYLTKPVRAAQLESCIWNHLHA